MIAKSLKKHKKVLKKFSEVNTSAKHMFSDFLLQANKWCTHGFKSKTYTPACFFMDFHKKPSFQYLVNSCSKFCFNAIFLVFKVCGSYSYIYFSDQVTS